MIINPNFYKTVKLADTAPKSDFNYTITNVNGIDYAVINYIDFTNNPNTAIRIPQYIEDSGISYPVAFSTTMFSNANTNLGNCNELTIDYKPYIYKTGGSEVHFRYPNQIKYLNLYSLEYNQIGSGSFSNFYYEMPSFLEELNLSVTILTKIPKNLFYNNQSINIDEVVANLVGANTITEIEKNAFSGCINLTSAIFNTVNTVREYAFYNCTALETISFPIATVIGDACFYGCSNLTNVSLPAIVSLTSGTIFRYCVALHELKLENATTVGINSNAPIFGDCSNLETVDLYETTSLIGYNSSYKVFNNCNNIKHIYLRASSKCSLSVAQGLCPTNSLVAIHVPSSLKASYQADSNWSAYSSYFVGDL